MNDPYGLPGTNFTARLGLRQAERVFSLFRSSKAYDQLKYTVLLHAPSLACDVDAKEAGKLTALYKKFLAEHPKEFTAPHPDKLGPDSLGRDPEAKEPWWQLVHLAGMQRFRDFSLIAVRGDWAQLHTYPRGSPKDRNIKTYDEVWSAGTDTIDELFAFELMLDLAQHDQDFAKIIQPIREALDARYEGAFKTDTLKIIQLKEEALQTYGQDDYPIFSGQPYGLTLFPLVSDLYLKLLQPQVISKFYDYFPYKFPIVAGFNQRAPFCSYLQTRSSDEMTHLKGL
jgi:hypothetical protein